MITLHHIIRRQYLHIELNGMETDGLALQRRLSVLCQDHVTPAIEEVFEHFAPMDRHMVIERLEIDAGTVGLEHLERDLPEAIRTALGKTIQEHLPEMKSPLTDIRGNIQHKTPQEAISEAFLFFLKTGTLPWSFRLPPGSTLEQVVLGSLRQASFGPAGKDMVFRALADPTTRKRLVRQFSPAFLGTLVSELLPWYKAVIDEALQTVRGSAVKSADRIYFERLFWEKTFSALASGTALMAIDIVRSAWHALPEKMEGRAGIAEALERNWPGATTGTSEKISEVKKNEEPMPLGPPGSEKNSISDDRSRQEIYVEPAAADLPEPDKEADARRYMEEGLYIENAGLVLLHPFLPRFFEALGTAAGDRLLQPDRALVLLHFLATVQKVAPEYELILPKILCNVPLEAPAESDAALTDDEMKEAINLLGAIIRNWGALRNTSPDGLRGTFLLRSGKVSLRDDDWLLQVEPKTCDILLEQLPWGISTVKLPWMNKILWVEWG